jgi:hypothetical protein
MMASVIHEKREELVGKLNCPEEVRFVVFSEVTMKNGVF